MPHYNINADAEYQPRTNLPTLPISVQLAQKNEKSEFYLHPNAPIESEHRKHKNFSSPFAPIDKYGWRWREATDAKLKTYATVNLHIFFSYKDIQYQFADESIYRHHVLPCLTRTRRISNRQPISLPWEVYIYVPKEGRMKWAKLTLNIIDICAMQGVGSLNTYANNVGRVLEAKHSYSLEEKKNMLAQYRHNPMKFEIYSNGDTPLEEIKEETTMFYNEIADLIGVKTRSHWGMSTGKIVASLTTAWFSKELGISAEDFYKLTGLAGAKGITAISKIVQNKDLVYLAMTDGGRCVAERIPWDIELIQEGSIDDKTSGKRQKGFVTGMLVDIDMAGCYGNGLRNQKFAVGNPTIIHTPMSVSQFFTKYKSQLIPGLWTARISWKDAAFKQDVLISKVEKAFTTWDLAVADENSDDNQVYDAAMILTTSSVSHASLNHDLWQIIQQIASPQELKWIKENAVIESALIYEKKNRVEKVTEKMLRGVGCSSKRDAIIDGTKEWVEVDIKPLMNLLIKQRGMYQKKTPMNTFLKLIINTIYGCCASEYFSEKGTGISNTVVGSNITARARALGWCMAKGLHTYMTITDGGVFDINRVLKFKKKSLDLMERLHRNIFTENDRHIFAIPIPLMGYEIRDSNQMNCVMSNPADGVDYTFADINAWQHLKNTFPELDIFKLDQFSFESKGWYVKYTPHSKADYRLVTHNGKQKIALRGMPKIAVEGMDEKVVDPLADKLFDAIEKDEPLLISIEDTQLLSQADWERHPLKDVLLPHDEISDPKRFYSHTPLASRYTDLSHYKRIIKRYEAAKKSNDPHAVASIDLT